MSVAAPVQARGLGVAPSQPSPMPLPISPVQPDVGDAAFGALSISTMDVTGEAHMPLALVMLPGQMVVAVMPARISEDGLWVVAGEAAAGAGAGAE